MAGNSGSIQEAATVGGYELGVGSKPRELLCVLNGHLPHAQAGGYVSSGGAIVSGVAALRITTAGDHNDNDADNELVVTAPSTTSVVVEGETLSYVAITNTTIAASGSPAGSTGLTATTGTFGGQLLVHDGVSTQADLAFTVDLTETDAAGTLLPLISASSFGAGSLIMGAGSDRIEGAFVFGSGQDGGDLNILDATVQMTVDLGGNAGATVNKLEGSTTPTLTLGNMTSVDTDAAPMNVAVTGISGGTVHFAATCEQGTPAHSDFYRLSIRALAHPKGGI